MALGVKGKTFLKGEKKWIALGCLCDHLCDFTQNCISR